MELCDAEVGRESDAALQVPLAHNLEKGGGSLGGQWQVGRRVALTAQSEADRIFRACEARVRDLVEACPERRDLVHGDLLHSNVLVAEDASRASAVFSWKCSVRGDFLFDVAWCTFWSPWYPGIRGC
jgi:aminoglycoside phosphotransferase (APT) family kinase protein